MSRTFKNASNASDKSDTNLVVFVAGIYMDLVAVCPEFPISGTPVTGSHFLTGFGGKGANQCVMAAKMGARTAIVANIGDDDYGASYKKHLKELAVDISHLETIKNGNTGICLTAVESKEGLNKFIVIPGINSEAGHDFVMESEDIIETSHAVVCTNSNILGTLAALRLARKHKVLTILNAAPGKEDLDKELLENADILCVNEGEAEVLAGLACKTWDERKDCLESLAKMGCGAVVLTLGPEGAMVWEKGEVGSVPAKQVAGVEDTTGAGDAFVGCLAFYLVEMPGIGLMEAVRRSCKIASISVQKKGSQASYPRKEDIPDYLFSPT